MAVSNARSPCVGCATEAIYLKHKTMRVDIRRSEVLVQRIALLIGKGCFQYMSICTWPALPRLSRLPASVASSHERRATERDPEPVGRIAGSSAEKRSRNSCTTARFLALPCASQYCTLMLIALLGRRGPIVSTAERPPRIGIAGRVFENNSHRWTEAFEAGRASWKPRKVQAGFSHLARRGREFVEVKVCDDAEVTTTRPAACAKEVGIIGAIDSPRNDFPMSVDRQHIQRG